MIFFLLGTEKTVLSGGGLWPLPRRTRDTCAVLSGREFDLFFLCASDPSLGRKVGTSSVDGE